MSGTRMRAEFARRLPFETTIVICRGRDIVRLMAHEVFVNRLVRPGVVRFVSVLSRSPRSAPSAPLQLPAKGKWMVKILARANRFVVGMYRRQMKVIGYLGKLDEVFGAPVTTRSWDTLAAIAKVLDRGAA